MPNVNIFSQISYWPGWRVTLNLHSPNKIYTRHGDMAMPMCTREQIYTYPWYHLYFSMNLYYDVYLPRYFRCASVTIVVRLAGRFLIHYTVVPHVVLIHSYTCNNNKNRICVPYFFNHHDNIYFCFIQFSSLGLRLLARRCSFLRHWTVWIDLIYFLL